MAFIRALPEDNTFLDKAYLDNLKTISSKVNRERLLLGTWEYSDSDNSLITYDAITDAFSGAVSAKVKPGKYFITCDPARFGADSTVIILWSGLRAEKILQFDELSTAETAQKILQLKNQYSVPVANICIDQDGIGGGVCDQLPGCVNFTNNARPKEINGKQMNYANLKSQAYFKLADLINERAIYINCENQTMKERIVAELEQVRVKPSSTEGKLAIISKAEVKEQLGRSPDAADALMLRAYWELVPQGGGKVQIIELDKRNFSRMNRPNYEHIRFY